ncbi:MAG: anthranilate phosphoribosyltransferase [Paracoccaceae bacterium]|nr:MAG: anthranilate phosphoribosyltransferase [Alphaproteobacteria bacterium]
MHENMKALLSNATKGPISFKDAEFVFENIMDGNLSKVEISSFLTSLKVRGESIDELTAAASIMRKKSIKVLKSEDSIDIVGTGGDGMNTLNISTASSLTVASTGVKVAKHGNKKISSLAGASDTLDMLGINTQMDPEAAQKSLENFNFCFMLAPIYHPAMKNVMPVRQDLGFRTVFNILGPLTNPASVKYQLIGVYEKSLAVKMIEVLKNLNTKRAWVVHGSDGTDEISITGDTYVVELDDGNINEFKINPQDAKLKTCNFSEILGGSPQFNAQKIEQLVDGEKSGFFQSVIFNSAAALNISENTKNLQDGARLATDALLSGKTKKLIESLKSLKPSLS